MARATILITVAMACVGGSFALLIFAYGNGSGFMYVMAALVFILGVYLWNDAIKRASYQDNLARQDSKKLFSKMDEMIDRLGKINEDINKK